MAIPSINAEECTGCGLCVDACAADALSLVDDVCVVNEAECIECGICLDECAFEAITA
ncbi:MAG: 4Fe-4S binding protein [Eggerthellaceae bacterium]|nr:4Fe-4S binding protein [Eggerthellaceae bacterium]